MRLGKKNPYSPSKAEHAEDAGVPPYSPYILGGLGYSTDFLPSPHSTPVIKLGPSTIIDGPHTNTNLKCGMGEVDLLRKAYILKS